MTISYFERVVNRTGEAAEETAADTDHDAAMNTQLILAMKAAGMDPDADEDLAHFAKYLKTMTASKLKMAARRMTGTKATTAGKAARAASKD